jgi:hypothetical protein
VDFHDLRAIFPRPSSTPKHDKTVLDIDIRPAIDQQLHDFAVAAVAGEKHGRLAVGGFGIDADTLIEQRLYLRQVAFARGSQQIVRSRERNNHNR